MHGEMVKEFLDIVYKCPKIKIINPLKAQSNPICHLSSLLGAHHILQVSRIRFKLVCWPVKNAPRFKYINTFGPIQQRMLSCHRGIYEDSGNLRFGAGTMSQLLPYVTPSYPRAKKPTKIFLDCSLKFENKTQFSLEKSGAYHSMRQRHITKNLNPRRI